MRHPLGRRWSAQKEPQAPGAVSGRLDMSRPAQGGGGWVSGWRHTPLSLFNAPCLFTSKAMFYNILNSHIALLALSGAWDLALEWSCPLSVGRNE